MDFDTVFADLSRAVRLDKHDLDNQLTEHGELVRQVGDQLALYTAQRDAAKRNLEETEAEVDRDIREDAAAAKEKTTETDIKRRVVLDSRVNKARDRLADLTLITNRLQKLEQSYIERRHAFNKLVDLYSSQYWSKQHGGDSRAGRRERIEQAIVSNNGARRQRERVRHGDED